MVDVDLVEVPGTAPRIKSTFEVVARRPLALDLTTVDQRDQSVLETKAIFRFEGSTLTYCVGAPGQPRPTGFETTPGDLNTLVILQRESARRAWPMLTLPTHQDRHAGAPALRLGPSLVGTGETHAHLTPR